MRPEPAEDTEVERLLVGIQRAIGDANAPELLARDPRAFLEGAGLSPAEAALLAGRGAERLLTYRRLVRRGLAGAIKAEIPRAAARLDGSFEAWASDFLDAELPRSHYLRDVAFEFVEWAAPRWESDASLPPWLGELARHELSELEIAASEPEERGATGVELALELPVRIDRAARVYRYKHAVHLLSEDDAARDAPPARPTALLAYRDREHEVRFLELSPLAAEIVERLGGPCPLGEAIRSACSALEHVLDGSVVEGIATLLADLGERGVLLGAETAGGPAR